ncbi:MAG: response regulator transcription factor [Gemmatimonadaceae bacterium]
MRSILIVEDNETLAFGLRASLEVEGHTVDVANDGRQALERIGVNEPDLIILDLMLPEISGFEVLRRLRQSGSKAAVLVLSARDQEVDKVQGFRLGADDYVVKPVGVLELIARVDALFRRIGTRGGEIAESPGGEEYRFGDIVVDKTTRTIRRSDTLVEVRPMEFDLLLYLLEAEGRIVSRHALMQHVWRYASDIATRTIDQHIGRLRLKLEDDPTTPRHILTVRKAGYRIQF